METTPLRRIYRAAQLRSSQKRTLTFVTWQEAAAFRRFAADPRMFIQVAR